jgi:hypothetical protein
MKNDPDKTYTKEEVKELIEEAERLGYDIEKDSALENLTVSELETLVRTRQ